MKKINSELARIQKELKAPKDQWNGFAKFKYRNCEGILEAVKPLLNGLTLTLHDDLVMVGNRYYVKATATLSDGEESVSASAFAREPENKKGSDESQITGSASSYSRKYALSGLFCIDDGHDADNMDNREKSTAKPSNNGNKNGRIRACDLTLDQIGAFRVPDNWKTQYSGMMLRQIANDTTDAGVCKGIGWMEKAADVALKEPDDIYAQEVIKRFLNEAVTA